MLVFSGLVSIAVLWAASRAMDLTGVDTAVAVQIDASQYLLDNADLVRLENYTRYICLAEYQGISVSAS